MFMLVIWILVIVGIFLLVRGFASRPGVGGPAGNTEPPLEILKRRYAKGEIDKTEFEEKKKNLLGFVPEHAPRRNREQDNPSQPH